MSQVIIAGDTSGTITLQAPAVSGSSVLTLPATTATLATLTTPSFASTIGVGGATASASGAGISFPATQSASSNANTLDDYEEGTFTSTIIGLTSAGTGTYGAQNGKYTKIGNVVTFSVDINWTAHTGTGNMAIAGLPFTAAPISFQRYPNSNYNQNISLSANNYMVTYVSDNSTRVTLAQLPTGGGAPSQVPMDTSGEMFVAGLYLT